MARRVWRNGHTHVSVLSPGACMGELLACGERVQERSARVEPCGEVQRLNPRNLESQGACRASKDLALDNVTWRP